MNKRVITILGIAIVLIAISIIKLKSNKEKVANKLYIHDVTAPILVEVASPKQHTFEEGYHYLGTFEPFRQNTIGSDAAGKVIKIGFNEGDKLSKGQFLLKLDDEMLELQLENAQINLESQKNDDARNANLYKDNIITGVQYEKTKLALRAAEAQVKQMKRQLQNSSITSPFSGVVTKKMVDLGSFIGMGTPILELTDISSLKLNISVPERDVLKFKKGQAVTVFADVYQNKPFTTAEKLLWSRWQPVIAMLPTRDS
ncbi:MAG: efflux RND transporter periplasmic adaptor subunit, partial [Crocinitomicaceae bacterium]|nr:efflux RND transporter periplasmic adaptor subunit [Crocinitomicaceae bacterium]